MTMWMFNATQAWCAVYRAVLVAVSVWACFDDEPWWHSSDVWNVEIHNRLQRMQRQREGLILRTFEPAFDSDE